MYKCRDCFNLLDIANNDALCITPFNFYIYLSVCFSLSSSYSFRPPRVQTTVHHLRPLCISPNGALSSGIMHWVHHVPSHCTKPDFSRSHAHILMHLFTQNYMSVCTNVHLVCVNYSNKLCRVRSDVECDKSLTQTNRLVV